MIPRPTTASLAVEAGVWADVLVSRGLLHAAVLAPDGQWLVQPEPEGPVHVLPRPADVVELAAAIQHRIRSTRNHT